MKYQSLDSITHEQADAVARSADVYALSRVALSVALADDHLDWSTAFLLSLAQHENANVRGNALLGFGHLARRVPVPRPVPCRAHRLGMVEHITRERLPARPRHASERHVGVVVFEPAPGQPRSASAATPSSRTSE